MRLKPRATPDAWEHETFGEEQARLERGDPEYAEICEVVRQAKDKGEQASLSADKTKAEWDARVATQGGRTTSRCSDRRDTDAVVEGKGVAEVCLAQLGRQLCRAPSETCCPRAMRLQPARGSPASWRTSLLHGTRCSPISERCGALRSRICAAWMPLGRCCSRHAWPGAPPLRA